MGGADQEREGSFSQRKVTAKKKNRRVALSLILDVHRKPNFTLFAVFE